MINEQNIGIKFTNSVTGQKKLETYAQTLSSIQKLLKNMPSTIKFGDNDAQLKNMVKSLTNVDKNIEKIIDKMKNMNSESDSTKDKLKNAFSITSLALFYKKISDLYSIMQKNTKSSATYLENMNLLDVAYNNNTTSADRLVNRLTQMYGLDESWGYRTVGMFKQLSNAMGLADETGTKLSNTLTMLSIDLSSLYNTSTSDAVQKLASALAGQTKPIRSFGADITEVTLSQTLLNNNIDLMVRNLSYAEKRLLIVTTILQQTTEAQNDWARTIESVANQERILEEQVQRLNRALGNVFLPIMKQMLPYLNGILMAIIEIINWLAVLVGFNEEDFDFFGSADESINDLIDSIGVAKTETKKLNQGLRSFDKLNAIKTPTSSASGGGLGISPEILNLFNKTADDYLSKLTDVEMKATRIRDAILKWLGFTKQIDTATGKVSFKFDHITGGTVLGALAFGGVIYKGVKGVFTFFKGINNIFSGGKITSGVKGLTNFATTWKGIGRGVGLTGLTVATASAYDSMYSLVAETKEAEKAYGQLTVSVLGATASGALFGSTFGPIGAVIGGASGAVVSLIGSLAGYLDKTKEIEVANKVFDGQGIAIEALGLKYREMFADADVWTEELTKLKNEYEQTTQNVANAEQELDLFVRRLQLQDEAIDATQLQELNTKFDNLKTSTDEAIDASIAYEKALIQAYSSTSAESAESTAQQIADIEALRLKQKGYEDEYIDALRQITIERYTGGKSQEWYNQKVNELNVAFGKTPDTLANVSGAVDIFNNKLSKIDPKNTKTLNEEISKTSEEYNKTINLLNERKGEVNKYYDEQIEKQQKIIDNFDKTALWRELTPEEKERYNTAIKLVDKYKSEQETAINNIDETITKIQGSYKGFLATVYADLVKNGADTQANFKGVISTIEGDLNNLKNVDMSGWGEEMFNGMINSMTEEEKTALPKVQKKFHQFGIKGTDAFYKAVEEQLTDSEKIANVQGKVSQAGGFTVEGFRIGVDNEIKKHGAGDIGEKTTEETKDQLGIHSPSSVFEEIGINTIKGYINGIEKSQNSLLKSIDDLLSNVQTKFKENQLEFNISTDVEKSFNSILYKLEVFANKFRSGINSLLANMTSAMNNVTVGSDNKLYYNSMPYIYVPRFKQGLEYVPNDYYLAYLDEGERVLTKQENKEYTNNRKLGNATNKQPQVFNIYLDSEHKLATYSLEQLQEIAKNNGEPIRIGDY